MNMLCFHSCKLKGFLITSNLLMLITTYILSGLEKMNGMRSQILQSNK